MSARGKEVGTRKNSPHDGLEKTSVVGTSTELFSCAELELPAAGNSTTTSDSPSLSLENSSTLCDASSEYSLSLAKRAGGFGLLAS